MLLAFIAHKLIYSKMDEEYNKSKMKCKGGNHVYTERVDVDYSFIGVSTPEYTGEYFCINCGKPREK